MLVNTNLFSPAANQFRSSGGFNDGGFYNDAPRGTKDWYDYWVEQKRRCIEGYSIGGQKITGYHYWYLNFFPIQRTIVKGKSMKSAKKVKEFPAFWDGDYDWFWLTHIAEFGMKIEKYKTLNLGVDVAPEYVEIGGQHLVCVKARRKGFSYKGAAMLTRNFHLLRNTMNNAFAYDEDYLFGDALLDKTWVGVYHNNEHCPWGQPFLIDQNLYKQAGYTKVVDGKEIDAGRLNSIRGVGFHNNPDKSRGGSSKLTLWEEAGKFKDLIKSWSIAASTAEDGDYTVGIMIAFGTGGSGGFDMVGLEELFRKPEAYQILPVYNQWEEGLENTYCGYFVPIHKNKVGYMDEDGNSDLYLAKESEEKIREKKKQSSQEAYSQYVAEKPFTPAEALMETRKNILPTLELSQQKAYVIAEKLDNMSTCGKLYKKDGDVHFKIDLDLKPLDHYPHKDNDNLEGAVRVWEKAIINPQTTRPYDNMYFISLDPYAIEDAEDKTSVGSAYVFKRSTPYSPTYHSLPVASYVGRPDKLADFNKTLFLLAEYYNCKIGFENDRGNTIAHARATKQLHKLEGEFEFDYKEELKSKVRRKFGMHATQDRKREALIYMRDWLLEPVAYDMNDNEILRYEFIYDVGLLEELIKYNESGNFDRVSSLIIAMFYMKELQFKPMRENAEEEKKQDEFFKSIYHGVSR